MLATLCCELTVSVILWVMAPTGTPLQTSLVSNTLPSTTTETVTTMSTLATPTLSLLATPTSSPLSGTDYDLMQLFWIIVGSGGGCIIVLLACVVMVICMWCGLCARKKKRNLIYTLDGVSNISP